jgi:hypothetical protein
MKYFPKVSKRGLCVGLITHVSRNSLKVKQNEPYTPLIDFCRRKVTIVASNIDF